MVKKLLKLQELQNVVNQIYSTVQKECKRISSKFGYCSTENSPIFRAKFRDFFGRKFERIKAARKFECIPEISLIQE